MIARLRAAAAGRTGGSGWARRLAAPASVALALALFGAYGCGREPDPAGEPPPETQVEQEAPSRGGEAIIALDAEPKDLNCLRVADAPSVSICRVIAGTLLDYDRDVRLVPRLAESFEASDDGRELTFRLRKDVRWHDGHPLTSRDVLYTVEALRHLDAEIQGNLPALFEPLESIASADEHTVVVRYREPYALAYEAWTRAFIMPAHRPFGPGEETPLSRAPIGTGPFRFKHWEPGVQVVLEANEDHFDGPPWLDRITLRIVPDRGALLAGLKTQTIDIGGLNPLDVPPEDSGLPFTTIKYAGPRVDFILWNTRPDPGLFADARVRRAFSLAFDRQGYIDHVTEGNDLPAVSTFHPRGWAHDPSLEPLPHDPEAAARLLDEAGWRSEAGGARVTPRGPAAFTLLFNSANPAHEKIATLMKESLASLGVKVRLQGLDFPTLRDKVNARAFEAAVYRWYLDPDPDPYDFFHSREAEQGQNLGGYSNPEVDHLAEEGRRTLDLRRRADIYHQVERILREDQPYTFVSHPTVAIAVNRRIRGVEVGPRGFWGWYPAPMRWWVLQDPPRRTR